MVQILQAPERQPGFLESLLGSAKNKMDEYSQGQASRQAQEREYALKGGLETQKQDAKFANQMNLQKQKQEFESANLRGDLESDENNYATIADAFGKKFANIWKSSPTGGRTELLKGALDAKLRGYDIDEMLSNIPDQDSPNENIIPDISKKPTGLTVAEWTKEKRKEINEVNKPILKEIGELRKNIPLQEQSIQDIKDASPGVGWQDYLAEKYSFEPLNAFIINEKGEAFPLNTGSTNIFFPLICTR